MRAGIFIIFLLAGCLSKGVAQVYVQVGEARISPESIGLGYQFSTVPQYHTTTMLALPAGGWKKFTSQVQVSNQPNILWLRLPIAEVAALRSFDQIAVENPHLNSLRCWLVRGGLVVDSFALTGDHYPFSSRYLPNPNFVFPISSRGHVSDTLIMVIEKRSSKLEVPLRFYQLQEYQRVMHNTTAQQGIVIGILLMLIFFSTLLLLSYREQVYGWYALYLVSILVFFSADRGLVFQYINPHHPGANDLVRPFAFAFALIQLLFFFTNLLDVKKNAPNMYLLNKAVLIFYMIVFVTALATSVSGNHSLQGKWLYVNSILGPLILLMVVIESTYFVLKKVAFSWFAWLSFTIFLITSFIYSLGQNGLIHENAFVRNAHYIGVVFDIIIVSIALVWRYYYFKQKADNLQEEYNTQQRRIYAESAAWQKQEMQTLSSLLHDHVGAHLGFLRLKVDKMELTPEGRKEVGKLVADLGQEVRHMSHEFSPLFLQNLGLYAAIEALVQRVRKDTDIDFQLECIGKTDPLDVHYELLIFRIVQELIQNMIKHAKATEGILQVIQEDDLFGIYIEDNGIGSSQWSGAETKGIGLAGIEQLVNLLKGNFTVSAGEGKGFSISIEIPIRR